MTSSPRDPQLISLGRSIRQLREEKQLDAKALAERVGLLHWQITAIEEGRTDPDYETLLKLADALGISTAELAERAAANEGEEAAHE